MRRRSVAERRIVAVLAPVLFRDRADELYDLETDPGERRNLAPAHPDATRERLAELLKWNTHVASLYWGSSVYADNR